LFAALCVSSASDSLIHVAVDRWIVCILCGAVAGWVAACNSAWGIDELEFDGPVASNGLGGFATGGAGGAAQEVCPQGFACVPDPGAGDFVRPTLQDAPCPTEWIWTISLYDGVDPGCATCTCDPASGGRCHVLVRRYTNTACTALVVTTTAADGACEDTNTATVGYRTEVTTPTEGSCEPRGGGSNALGGATMCRLTETPELECGSGKVCVPEAQASLGATCALLPGHGVQCPDGYEVATTHYEQAADWRDCTCTCGAASGALCPATAELFLYSQDGCEQTLVKTIPVPDDCASAGAAGESYLVEAGGWAGGSCQPNPPTGQVSFSVPVTLCCPS
jgi:hypothetical protein